MAEQRRRGAAPKKGQGRGGRPSQSSQSGQPRRRGQAGPGGQSGHGGHGGQGTRRDRPRSSEQRSAEQQRYDGPDLPESVTGRELPPSVRAQLKSLPEKLALRVARHLVAAEQLLESDPRTAYEHTLAARARAGRLAVVREAVGEAAYAAGEYAEALAELKAARRMNGAVDYTAMMADCERALGRPDRALKLARDVDRDKLSNDQQAELVIVEAGARRDRGELDAALRILENAPLMSRSRAPWVARLRYVYADTLAEAGRDADALAWFHRTEAVDPHHVTDAVQRAAALED